MTILAETTEQVAGTASLWPTVWIALLTGAAAIASSVLSQLVTARSASRAAKDARDHEIALNAAQERHAALDQRTGSYLRFIQSASELLLEMGKSDSDSSGRIRSLAHGALVTALSVQLHGSQAAGDQAARMSQALGYKAHGTPLWIDRGSSVDAGVISLSADLARFLNIVRSEQLVS